MFFFLRFNCTRIGDLVYGQSVKPKGEPRSMLAYFEIVYLKGIPPKGLPETKGSAALADSYMGMARSWNSNPGRYGEPGILPACARRAAG